MLIPILKNLFLFKSFVKILKYANVIFLCESVPCPIGKVSIAFKPVFLPEYLYKNLVHRLQMPMGIN